MAIFSHYCGARSTATDLSRVKPDSTYKTSNVAIGCLKATHQPKGRKGKKERGKKEEKEGQEGNEERKRQALV